MKLWTIIDDQRMFTEEFEMLDYGLFRLAYFYEHWGNDNKYELTDNNGQVINHGSKLAMCYGCHIKKSLAQELNSCHSCLQKHYDNRIYQEGHHDN